MHWYIDVLKKYIQFDGRARSSEYWFFNLFNFIVSLVICFVIFLPFAFGASRDNATLPLIGMGLLTLYCFATFLPGLGVMVRRLHDTGKSGWWFLINFVPLVGPIILLVFMFTDSQPGPNQYGQNPKEMVPPGDLRERYS